MTAPSASVTGNVPATVTATPTTTATLGEQPQQDLLCQTQGARVLFCQPQRNRVLPQPVQGPAFMMQFIMQLLVMVPFTVTFMLHMLGFRFLLGDFRDFKMEDSGIC